MINKRFELVWDIGAIIISQNDTEWDFEKDILSPERERVNDDLELLMEETEDRVEQGVVLFPEVDMAVDEVVSIGNRDPELSMHREAKRFLMPTKYDDASPGDGPKRLRPTVERIVGSSPDVSSENDWDEILDEPGENPEHNYIRTVQRISLSVELLHNFTLEHDDVADEDDKRRTVDTGWESRRKQAEDLGWEGEEARKMGENKAINDGDYIRTLMDQAVFSSNLTADKKDEIKRVLTAAEQRIIMGQERDQWMEGLNFQDLFEGNRTGLRDFLTSQEGQSRDSPEEMYLDMIDKKTVDLFVASVDIGAIVANYDEETRDHLRRYARNVAVPFQIRDDVLEIETASSLVDTDNNKDPTDIIKGKTNYPALEAYHNILTSIEEIRSTDNLDLSDQERLDKLEKDREIFENLYGNVSKEDKDSIETVADVIYRHQNASEFYDNMIEKGAEHLREADIQGEQEEKLMAFARYLKDRNY